MSNTTYMVAARIGPETRTLLLRTYPPRFQLAYCFQITWAYGTPPTIDFPRGELMCTIIGRHGSSRGEALICRLGEHCWRPDGRPLSITLSVAPGTPPATVNAAIDPDEVTPVDPVCFPVRLLCMQARMDKPTARDDNFQRTA